MDQLDLVARLGVALARAPWLCLWALADAPRDSGQSWSSWSARGRLRLVAVVDEAAAARPGEVSRPPPACAKLSLLTHQHDAAIRRFSVALHLAGTSCPPHAPILHAHLGEQKLIALVPAQPHSPRAGRQNPS
ncbi:hypothetical protein PVAP13_5KG623907 [Panicum virgatum]|uniref:Uncharacterized protein n=1 Tax=Panicum virgatum TaxID=38727 RepID=A0A8T0SUS5_PANVG|nr:hypothetical protein PVAP13_5KG623907 [Panicum virgatum]